MNEANRRLSPARIPGGFSGPTAIAAVTGRPIRDVLGTVGNGFMSMTEIGSAIRNLGGQCSEDRRLLLDRQQSRGAASNDPLPTLGEWLRAGYHEDGTAHLVFLDVPPDPGEPTLPSSDDFLTAVRERRHARTHVVAVAGGETVDNGKIFRPKPSRIGGEALSCTHRLADPLWLRMPSPGEANPDDRTERDDQALRTLYGCFSREVYRADWISPGDPDRVAEFQEWLREYDRRMRDAGGEKPGDMEAVRVGWERYRQAEESSQ